MTGRTGVKLSDEIREKLAELRKTAGNPSIDHLGLVVGVSPSTIRTALSGYSVKWKTYQGLLEALNCTPQEISDFRDAWIRSKTAAMPEVNGPLWAQRLHDRMDEVLKLLAEIRNDKA